MEELSEESTSIVAEAESGVDERSVYHGTVTLILDSGEKFVLMFFDIRIKRISDGDFANESASLGDAVGPLIFPGGEVVGIYRRKFAVERSFHRHFNDGNADALVYANFLLHLIFLM